MECLATGLGLSSRTQLLMVSKLALNTDRDTFCGFCNEQNSCRNSVQSGDSMQCVCVCVCARAQETAVNAGSPRVTVITCESKA
jgi:hypothetical protein